MRDFIDESQASENLALPFFAASSLAGRAVPERHWLVHELVPSRTVTLFGGDGGTGKSLLALQLACGVATNSGWLGRGASHGRALYISAEDDDAELHRRLAAISRAYAIGLGALTELTALSLAGRDALLCTEAANRSLVATPLFAKIEERALAEQPALIVLDTLADFFPGNENDRAQVRQFIGLLRGLAIRRDCAVLLLAHPSLTGMATGTGSSGSTAWNNSVRSRIYLERIIQDGYESDPDARCLSCKKANYGRIGSEISMRWKDGVFVADEPETGLDRLASSAKAQRIFLELLRKYSEQGRKVNASGGSTYAPNEFSKHPNSGGISKRAFRDSMNSLLAEGKIEILSDGPPSKPRSFLSIKGA